MQSETSGAMGSTCHTGHSLVEIMTLGGVLGESENIVWCSRMAKAVAATETNPAGMSSVGDNFVADMTDCREG